MKFALALAVTTSAACINPNLTHCPGDYDCAPGLVCDLAHHGCVQQDQLDVCGPLGPLAPCSTPTVSGECFDGVCLAPGCGNRVIEVGEQCDDGNHVSGDGCSLDCSSSERCGNGKLDLALGEQCDDGNAISHDGCDSVCGAETARFRAIPMAMMAAVHPRTTAYDPVRHRLVVVNAQTTWEWDGQAWQIPSLQHSAIYTVQQLVYDSDRQRITGLGADIGGKPVVADWDGTTWTEIVVAGNGPVPLSVAVYDPTQHAILTMTNASLQYLDVANKKWGQVVLPGFTVSPSAIATVDATRGTIVMIDPSIDGTWELLGTTWKFAAGTRPVADDGWALVYDASLGGVIAIGGKLNAGGFDGTVQRWGGASWLDTTTRIKPRANAVAWYDPTSMTVSMFGGVNATGELRDIVELTPAGEIDHTAQLADQNGLVFYDSGQHRLLLFNDQKQWSFDGRWHALGPASGLAMIGYDPVRGGMLGLSQGSAKCSIFTQDTWHQLAIDAPTNTSAPTATYDYAQRRMVEVDPMVTKALPSSATSWNNVGPGIMGIGSVAFDRGLQRVVSLGNTTDGVLSDLDGAVWQPSLSPGFGYIVGSWLARGSVVMVPITSLGSMNRQIWERHDGTFASLGTLPTNQVQIRGIAEMGHGQLVIAANDADSAFLLSYQFTNGLADESCIPGEDVDGDGLAGCDDPDCWESCWPVCPYATSCAP